MKVGLSNIPNSQLFTESNESPRFRGKSDIGKIGKDISKNSHWLPRALTYLGQNDGEILNTVVTAVGTAAVAPVFIAGNPFSKEDKETKWYSALRQPISAVIALVFQLYVNNKFNNWMAQQASNGRFGEPYDLRAMPKANYLKRIIKLEHPEFTKEQIESEIVKRQSQAEKRIVAEVREAMKDKKIEIKDLLSKDALDEAKKQLVEEYKKQHQSELQGFNNANIDRTLHTKINSQMIEERALANIQKSVEMEAKAKYQIRELAKKFDTVEDAIQHMADKLSDKAQDSELTKNVIERLENIKDFEKAQGTKPFSSVKDLGKNYEKVLHNVKVKKLVKARTSDAQKAFGKANKQLGIIVSLITLPFSCGLLNWAYPRVMEYVMPKIQPWIHRNDKDWTPEKAKKYGPPEKIAKQDKAKSVKEEDDD